MKYFKSILFFLSTLVVLSCSSDDGKISFTLLQLNDVYEISSIQGGKFGGMARVKTIHKELLKENKNTLLVMAGDFLNPSLIGTMKYNGERIRGKQMVEVMNAMNFDVAAIGNHEFDLSKKDLQTRMDESIFPWISSNVFNRTKDSIKRFYQEINGLKTPIKGSFIKEISDNDGTKIKIGFISVCIPSNPKDYVLYKEMFSSIQKEYESIKNKVDLVIGLTHVKIEHDREIAKLLPNIPLIMGGHEHDHKNEMIGNVKITKADANAKTAYIHYVTYNKISNETKISSVLKTIDNSISDDVEVKAIVDKWLKIMENQISMIVENPYDIIYSTETPLDGRDIPIRSIQTNLGNLIAKSMAFSYGNKVDCSIVNGGSIRIDDQLVGDINSVDAFRVLPFGGAVLKVKMKGSLLNKVLEYGNNAAGSGAYLQRSSIEMNDTLFTIDNSTINPSKIYTIAISDYLMKGFDIPFLTPNHPDVISVYTPNLTETSSDIRKGMILYLKSF
ncbi:bifunctional metallophosphatase/5'-nucleotidase [Flavobacteriaceae bacterium]|nr:bifunctional metallophosphatase/5'-nucleotidase [Flavobacteriaceae bacterium]